MNGILSSSLSRNGDMDPFDAIKTTARLGLKTCLFNSLLDLDPKLDRYILRDLKVTADDHGVGIAGGAGWINPLHPWRNTPLSVLGKGEIHRGVVRLVEAAAGIGLTDLFFMIGILEDRFDQTTLWSEQLRAIGSLLADIAPILRDHAMHMNIKTHEEITSFEIRRLVEMGGPDVVGVAFDPVNVLVRLEDPSAAAQRLAPHVRQLHLDDAVVRFDGDELRRFLCPMGEGVVDWPYIFALVPNVPRFIDLHRGQFTMAVFDPAFLKHQPDLTVRELASVIAMAVRRESNGACWDQSNPVERLHTTLAYLESKNKNGSGP